MARLILNDGDSGLSFRTKLNDNFMELYELAETMSAWKTAVPSVETITDVPVTLKYLDTLSHEKEIVYDPATGIFTVVKAGGYKFDDYFSGHWASGVEVYFSFWVNGVQVGSEVVETGLGTTKDVVTSISTFVKLPANATLEIRARVDSGSTDLTFNSGTTILDLKFYV